MDTPVPLQFRPTLIIFVGATGEIPGGQVAKTAGVPVQEQATGSASSSPKSVYGYFCDLSGMLDPVLAQGIGLLTIEEGGIQTKVLSMDGSVVKSGDFTPLLTATLHAIRDYRSVHEIADASYPVLTPYPQIYIVGQTDSIQIVTVAEQVNTLLGNERPLALISYVLIEEHTSLPQQPLVRCLWVENLLSHGPSMPEVNFCYLYEEMGQHLLYMKEEDRRYAAAEALFGFVATGITAASSFKAATSLSLATITTEARIGSVGTSLLRFPRTTVERYCVDMQGVELVNNWGKTLLLSKEQQATLNLHLLEQAQADAQRIHDTLANDDTPRPGFSEGSWPSLTFLGDDTLTCRITEATERIFRQFSNYKHWAADPGSHEAQALQALSTWQDITKEAWEHARSILEQETRGKVDRLWLQDEQGLLTAKIYTPHLERALGQARDSLDSLSVSHQETYEGARQGLQELGNGPWVSQPSATTNQAGGIPNHEREIIENLSIRVVWLRKHVPTITIPVTMSIMAMIALVWLLLTLLPLAWLATPLSITLSVAVGTGLSAAGAWFYRYWRQRHVRSAQEDLLRAYYLYFAYQCEYWEDMLRSSVLDTLLHTVQEIAKQLKAVEGYLSNIAQAFHDDADDAEQELFDSPSSYRDIFIGNKEILSKYGYRLAKFNQAIMDLRQTAPKEEWHQTPSKAYQRLGEFLKKQGISLTGIQQDDLQNYIRQFTSLLVTPYLRGELVEIAPALKAQGDGGQRLIGKAIENAQVLYRPYQTIPVLSYYICGHQDQCNAIPEQALPPGATIIWTTSPDWLLLTCFWTGGAHTRWSTKANAQTMPSSTVATGLSSTPAWP